MLIINTQQFAIAKGSFCFERVKILKFDALKKVINRICHCVLIVEMLKIEIAKKKNLMEKTFLALSENLISVKFFQTFGIYYIKLFWYFFYLTECSFNFLASHFK